MLSHPLIVDAAENAFVPLCIHNNTEGDHDASVRERFDEPSWNNPVVRFLDRDHADLVPSITSDWSLSALATQMVRALGKSGKEVPAYLRLFADEEVARARGVEAAVFGMG